MSARAAVRLTANARQRGLLGQVGAVRSRARALRRGACADWYGWERAAQNLREA